MIPTDAPNPAPGHHSCFIIGNDDAMILWDYVVILVFETGMYHMEQGLGIHRHIQSFLSSLFTEEYISVRCDSDFWTY